MVGGGGVGCGVVCGLVTPVDGPYYDELEVGQVLPRQPSVTVDGAMAAIYQSIVGEYLPMMLDPGVCEAVTGVRSQLVSPALVMHLSIGQSTTLTRRAISNLFYRNVRFLRPVRVGQSISTTVTVSKLCDSRPRPGRPLRGKALVNIVTTADGEPAVTYQRAPLLPQTGTTQPGHQDDFDGTPELDLAGHAGLVPPHWDLAKLGPPAAWQPGETIADPARDIIDNALPLVRMTQNLARVHRDATLSPYPQRLVYGGHVVGLAQASLTRVLPGVATVLGWHACGHTGPAFEGDQVSFQHTLVDTVSGTDGRLLAVRTEGFAERDGAPHAILDWTVIIAAS